MPSFPWTDSNECEYPNTYCLGGECLNTPGSYTCHCQLGFELFNGTTCEGKPSVTHLDEFAHSSLI